MSPAFHRFGLDARGLACALAVACAGLVPAVATHAGDAGALRPRTSLPKADAVTQPAHDHRLIVKFRDDLLVRAVQGGLLSLSGADLDEATALALRHDASFSQLIDLPVATIQRLERRAARASGVAQPDLAGMLEVHAPGARLQQIADSLNATPLTEFVHFQQLMPDPPCFDIAPTTNDYRALQAYHDAAIGVKMSDAWLLGDARGTGIRIADCEYGYVDAHEDLCDIVMEPGQTIHPDVVNNGWDEHGTAVFGEMIGVDNAYGVTGLAPDADGLFFTEWSVEQGFRRETAIANAIASVDSGDVVVLEMQVTGPGGGYGPAELDPAVWTLVRNGADAGIVVVAAAGNGDQNLDSSAYAEYRSRGDSGSIIVGAGTADAQHDKLWFSTYGARVDVQGFGESVFTTGYGNYAQHGGDKNQRYTHTFNGTSSATPIVAGCCAALQSIAVERLGRRLAPDEIRGILVETGTPQGAGGHIGPLPDMLAAIAALSVGETICPDDPDDFVKSFGGVVTGDALDLCAADDLRMEVLQSAQLSPLLPYIRLEFWAHATPSDGSIGSVEYMIEGHVSALVAGGQNPDTLRTFIRNYAGGFELIDERGTSANTDETITHVQTTNAPDYVNAGDGEVRVMQEAWDPGLVFTPNWFLKVDLYEVTVGE
jgi:hypothetical protein